MDAVAVQLENSSLASQAVGPPLSNMEMSADGRSWPKVGKKMVSLRPLAQQRVALTDSVLGTSSAMRMLRPGLLDSNYGELIKKAFSSDWWSSDKTITFLPSGEAVVGPPKPVLGPDEYTLMEANFSLFFGIAVQLYESTLVSNNAPFDRFQEGNSRALNAAQKRGMGIFFGQGKCANCHSGAEFTNASVQNVANQKLKQMVMGDGQLAVYDNGFYNIGVRPTTDDVGVGGVAGVGAPPKPLCMARQQQQGDVIDPTLPVGDELGRVACDGAFKAAGLRNVELTAPYFHNGGQLTLKQVTQFYNRGGDFSDENQQDLDIDVEPLGLTDAQLDDLVAFLKSLTDERVRFRKAPFDAPQLFVPNGHFDDPDDGMEAAEDRMIEIPAVGKFGGLPLPGFARGLAP